MTAATRQADERWVRDWISRTGDQILIQARGDEDRARAITRRLAEMLTAQAHDNLAGLLGVGIAETCDDTIAISVEGKPHRAISAGALRQELRVSLVGSVDLMLRERDFRAHMLAREDPFELPEFDAPAAEGSNSLPQAP